MSRVLWAGVGKPLPGACDSATPSHSYSVRIGYLSTCEFPHAGQARPARQTASPGPGLASPSALICRAPSTMYKKTSNYFPPRRFHHHLLHLLPSRCARHQRSGGCAARPAPPCLNFPAHDDQSRKCRTPSSPALRAWSITIRRSRSRAFPDPPDACRRADLPLSPSPIRYRHEPPPNPATHPT